VRGMDAEDERRVGGASNEPLERGAHAGGTKLPKESALPRDPARHPHAVGEIDEPLDEILEGSRLHDWALLYPIVVASFAMVPSKDDDYRDRREHERAAITLRVDYKRMNTFFADYAKNISKGGTFIKTTKPLDVGTEFVFVLSIPARQEQLQLLGEVMWTVTE